MAGLETTVWSNLKWLGFFWNARKKTMAGKKKEESKKEGHAPVQRGHKTSQANVSGVPGSTGGSRHGNIGHQGNNNTDNANR